MRRTTCGLAAAVAAMMAAALLSAQAPEDGPSRPARPPRPGVSTPGVKRDIAAVKPIASFPVEGNPDWQVVTDDAVWVTSGRKDIVARLDPKTNTVAAVVE